jgi:NADH-quinone oxidoreductase subunit N
MSHPGEYYSLVVFSILGAVMMAASGELLTAYISVELLSFSLYILVSLTRGDQRSAEAGTKYILLGALSSAILLYGISIIYGTMGTTYNQILGALMDQVDRTRFVEEIRRRAASNPKWVRLEDV